MNRNVVIQEETVTLEYVFDGKVKVPVRKKGQRVLEERIVPRSEFRHGIGGILFEKKPEYQYPVITVTRTEADRILSAEEKKGTHYFRIAVPKRGKE